MAKKSGAVKQDEKHEEKTRAEIALIEKKEQVKDLAKKRKRGLKMIKRDTANTRIITTDAKKWERYFKQNRITT